MSRYARVSAIGTGLYVDTNRSRDFSFIYESTISFWDRQLKAVLPAKPDLVVFYETCDTPFGGLAIPEIHQYYAQYGGKLLDYFRSVARDHHCYLAYPSMRYDEQGSFRNSIRMIDRSGSVIGCYDKNYPTQNELEAYKIKAADALALIRCDFGTVAPIICFDLNFEALRLKMEQARPDIILFSSMYHGGFIQRYWAYSCRAHFVGAVRNSRCTVLSPTGDVLGMSGDIWSRVTADINLDCRLIHYDQNDAAMQRARDMYGPGIRFSDTEHINVYVLWSELPDVSADEMIERSGIIGLDTYFNDFLEFRQGQLRNKQP